MLLQVRQEQRTSGKFAFLDVTTPSRLVGAFTAQQDSFETPWET